MAALKDVSREFPMIVIEPLLCFIKPTIIRIIVVLPAPFGPNNPTTCPCSTEKEALSMICLVPISFDTFFSVSISVISSLLPIRFFFTFMIIVITTIPLEY